MKCQHANHVSRRSMLKGAACGAAAYAITDTPPISVSAQSAFRSVDLVVVGAGAAGLMAATHLKQAGKSVVVLEANDRVGGRLKPANFAGQTIDLGGMWVGPGQDRAYALAKDFGMKTFPTPEHGRIVTEVGGAKSFSLAPPGEALAEFTKVAGMVQRHIAEIPLAEPWKAPRAREWDRITVASWIDEVAQQHYTRDYYRIIVEAVLSVDPAQVSLLAFLTYIGTTGGLLSATANAGGAQQDLFVDGYAALPQKLAENLGDVVHLETPVHEIEQDENGVVIRTGNGSWRAQRVIVAVPPTTARRITFTPTLPYKRRALMERMPMGSVIKCFLAYDEPFWRNDDLSGQGALASAEFSIFYDVTVPGNERGIIAGFFDGGPAQHWADKPKAERRERVIEDVAFALGDKARRPIDYVEQVWPKEQWSVGGYACIPGTGVLTHFGEALRAPCGRIHWAGTETAVEWYGYVEGALRSGDRAAEEVLARMNAALA